MTIPTDIFSVASVRAIDRAAIDGAGVDGYLLMTRAAEAALEIARETWPAAARWQILCGSGNNGGDGYVLARLAMACGIDVSVIALSAPDELQGDAARGWQDFAAAGGVAAPFAGQLDDSAELLVDALLGSGLQRELAGEYAAAVAAINAHAAPVMALDVPSGLHADTGHVLGSAVRAAVTITFVGLKTGLFLAAGPDCVGRLYCAGLDIPATCYAAQPVALRRIDNTDVAGALPNRRPGAHKGSFGHVLVVGGAPGMAGAVRLCAEAALRSGAGAVSIATHPDHHALVAADRPELMCHAVATPDDLAPLLARATGIAIGPGLGRSDWSRSLLDTVLAADLPLVVDADALNLLCDAGIRRNDWILTPHPGEAARLLGIGSADVQADRRGALAGLVAQYGGCVVLKGAGTLVSSASGPHWICTGGNPGMAAPGMGDVLTGIIAAIRAQGAAPELAAAAGVFVHAAAGDSAAVFGERGLLASDLLEELRAWVNP